MSRRWLPWLVAIPLMVAGSSCAHELSYWLVVPDPSERAHVLEASGHGYLAEVPLVLGILGALLLAALVGRAASSLRGAAPGRVAAWPFLLLPLFGFGLQEYLERFVHAGDVSLLAGLEPTFLIGLALQVPFGLAAYTIARLLLHVADRVGHALVGAQRPSIPRPIRAAACSSTSVLPRQRVSARGYTERGPPAVAV